MDLNNVQKQHLRKLGVEMKPSVWIGKEGVNDGVIKNTRAGLLANELIKVKVNQNNADERGDFFTVLADATGASLVHVIGRTALLFKQKSKDSKIDLPSA
jgi:RNA-binding protein